MAIHDQREAENGDRNRCDRQRPDAERRGEWVVEEAVGDEAVPARVPEVVPEDEAVPEEHQPAVGVCGEVGSRGCTPEEDGGERGAVIVPTDPSDDKSPSRSCRPS